MDYQEVASQFEADGCAVVRGVFTEEEVAEMERQISAYIRDTVPALPPSDVYYEDAPERPIKSLFRLEEHSPFFRDLMTHPRLVAIAQAIFGDAEVVPIGSFFFGKAARSGSVTPPHQDNAFQNLKPAEAFVATISIDASTPENGALTCQKGSHKLGILPHRPSGVMGFSQTLVSPLSTTEYPEVQLCMTPGDVALHHTNTIHRSEGNTTDRSRRQLGVQYYSSRAKRDEESWARYQEELQKLHKEKSN